MDFFLKPIRSVSLGVRDTIFGGMQEHIDSERADLMGKGQYLGI